MATKKTGFEEQMARIEEIVARLDAGDTDLDGSLKLYEEGIRLVRACTKRLDEAEQTVKLLRTQPDGKLALVDFSADSE